MAQYHEIEGIIRKHGAEISIEMSSESIERVGALDETFENGQPVKMMIWDARPLAERSDLEQVSEVQQLPKDVVAQGLLTQGAIQDKAEFLTRLFASQT
jgi:hypothetical protein